MESSRRTGSSDIPRLRSLIEASKLLNSTLDLERLLSIILDLAVKNLKAARGTIYLVDYNTGELWAKVRKGREPIEIRLPIGTGIAGYVAKTGRTVNIEDAQRDKRFFGGIDKQSGFVTKTMLCMPLRNRQRKIIGVFQILNKLKGPFTKEDEQFLIAFSEHAALAIENARLHREIIEKEKIEKEIEIAAAIQQRLFPKELPLVRGYALSAAILPCKSVGGDYYDCIPMENGHYAVVMADVSGKGVPASLLVSSLHASLHAFIRNDTPLSVLVAKLNDVVFRNTLPESFVTFFIGLLNPDMHSLEYVNAGHPYPCLFRASAAKCEELTVGGLPLGMIPDWEYESAVVGLHEGDVLTIYTDGVTEAADIREEQFGEDNLKSTILSSAGSPLPEMQLEILENVKRFAGSEPQSDDITLFLVKRSQL